MGGLINAMHFPSVDSLFGDVLKYPEMLGRALELVPESVMVISGHGRPCTFDEARTYHEMLDSTLAIVRKGLAEGKDLTTLQEEKVLKDYESYEGGYISADRWIQYLVEGLQHKPRRETLVEPLYYVLKERDAEAAIARYHELKKTHPDKYTFNAVPFMIIGNWLLDKGRAPEAIKLLELGLEEYPDSPYLWYTHSRLGAACREVGDKESAVEHYRIVLQFRPDDPDAAQALKELERR